MKCQEPDAPLRRMPGAHTRGGGTQNRKAGGQRLPFLSLSPKKKTFRASPYRETCHSLIRVSRLKTFVTFLRTPRGNLRCRGREGGGRSLGFQGCWLGAEQMCWLVQRARFRDWGKEQRKERGKKLKKEKKLPPTCRPHRSAVGLSLCTQREGPPPRPGPRLPYSLLKFFMII